MKTYKYIILLGLILLLYSNSAIALEDVFEVNLIFNREDNSVELSSIRVMQWYVNVESTQPGQNIENKYEVRLGSRTGSTLYSTYVEPSFIVLSEPPELLDTSLVILYMPFSRGAKVLKVFYQGGEKLSVNFSNLICNYNGICDNSETYLSCSNDCKWYAKDTICNSESNDFYCDWDCLFDADSTGECYKANCNPGGGLSGDICQQYLCTNNKKDLLEESIDCGGICPDNCPVDFCGDGICAEYEIETNCPDDCAPAESILKNTGTKSLIGYLVMNVQKLVDTKWSDEQTVVQDDVLRTIEPGEEINLRNIWNKENYIIKEAGKFRIYAGFFNEKRETLLSDSYDFGVSAVKETVSAGEKTTIRILKQKIAAIQQKISRLLSQLLQLLR